MEFQSILKGEYTKRHSIVLGQIVVTVAAVTVLTLTANFLHLELPSAGFLYLLLTVFIALAEGFWQATLASLIAVCFLNYFFVRPAYSFYVAERQDLVALVVFEITALVVSQLSASADAHAKERLLQKQTIEKLYELSRGTLLLDLHQAPGPQIVRLIRHIFDLKAVALFDESLDRVDKAGDCTPNDELLVRRTYFQEISHDDDATETSQRLLSLGITAIGSLVIRGTQAPLVANALASLTAIALERYRSFERESYAKAAHQSEELRTAVLDALAHAFKTPLTVIRIASSGLLEKGELDDQQQALALLIDEQSIHLNELATQLLQTARLEAEDINVRKETVIISAILERVLQEQTGRLMGHPVEVEFADASLVTLGDPGLIATIVTQFMDNATKYSNPGSPICIGARRSHSEILISVHNDGPTIRMQDRDKIFERFYRCPESKHFAAGTGLGLSIAKRAADAQHGHVWVISGEGEGTTFFLALPAA